MERGPLVTELSESVSLLRSEIWLFLGLGLAWITYGGWVIATGSILRRAAPGLDGLVLTTIDGVGLSAMNVVAGVLWLVVPGLIAVLLVNRRLRNSYGNLANAYRLDHPSLLLVVPGVALLTCLLFSVTVGRQAPVTALALVASAHLVVRTVAYGHRVYTLSVPAILSLLVFLAAGALGAGWLVQVTALDVGPAELALWIERAGVGRVVESVLVLAGIHPAQVLTLSVAVPGVLAVAYLIPQLVAGAVVRLRAPLSDPQRRPDQRFPIMPPVTAPRDGSEATDVPAVDGTEPATPAEASESPDGHSHSADTDTTKQTPEHTGTRVYDPDDTPPSAPPARESNSDQSPDLGEPKPTSESTDTESDTDEWIDDTAVFTPGGRSDPSQCKDCGASIGSAATTCPSCGNPVDE